LNKKMSLDERLDDRICDGLRQLLEKTLELGERSKELVPQSRLLGELPELDSMAVAQLLTAMESKFNIRIDDSQISADDFETLGSLVDFVKEHIQQ